MTTPKPDFPTVDQMVDPPRLVIGWRRGQKLEGRRIELDANTFDTFRQICAPALDKANADTTEAREYQAFGVLEAEQVFFIRPGAASAADLDSASIVHLVNAVDELEPADTTEEKKLTFYAIVWGLAGERVAFVRKADPRSTLSKGKLFFAWDNALKRVARPDFVLDPVVDLIIGGETAVILNEVNSRTLMNDIGLASTQVGQNVSGLETILGGDDSITAESRAALLQAGSSGVQIARRLAQFNAYYSGRTLDRAKIREQALEKFGSDADELIDADGRLCADSSHLKQALDLIEGRLFTDPISTEDRRADRLSKR